jgi:hydrogenase nickel incorporation protein HypB
MCATCGCNDRPFLAPPRALAPAPHQHFARVVESSNPRLVRLEHDLLHKNDQLAQRNRRWFESRGILALNFVSSPGSGKTTLLERTISDLRLRAQLFVLQGDQATDRDAERIRRAGAPALQINTGTGCHLDAAMVAKGLSELEPAKGCILAIENVGNLVCPALFDLGEAARIAIISVCEGADKPIKYPYMFRSSDLVLINKIDLSPHVDFDLAACRADLAQVNPAAQVLTISAKRGDGLDQWYAWLEQRLAGAESPP